MIPILYPAFVDATSLQDVLGSDLFGSSGDLLYSNDSEIGTETFSTMGLGRLMDCISCSVKEERNGTYELEMEYPITGVHFDEIELRCLILARPNYADGLQAFRIYQITAPINGVVSIIARHLTYDLGGVPVLPFTATSAGDACQGLMDHSIIEHPFNVGTQLPTIADFKVDVPSSIRSWFGGKEGSLIDVYGGEWHYDNYAATLMKNRGTDRGVVIKYGKNLIDFEQEANCENVYTGVLPYWKDEEGTLVKADVVKVQGSYAYDRIMCLDLSDDFEEVPTIEQLRDRAARYIESNDIGVPKVSITLDWVQTSELFDRVDLCDTVLIEFEKIGVSARAKCISTTWDVLKERYSSIEFGDARTDIVDTLADLTVSEEKAQTSVSTVMLRAIQNATALITGNKGGYVIMHDGDGDGTPDEILIMDTDDIETATKVWRWNLNGLGYSSSGYNGSFGTAITMDGAIVADYITAGTLKSVNIEGVNIAGTNITGGTVSGATVSGGTVTGAAINNGSGSFVVDADGNVTASKVAITGGYIDLTTTNVLSGLTLKNQAGDVFTQQSAAIRRRYSGNNLVLQEVAGAILATSFGEISDRRHKDILEEEIPDVSTIRAVRFRWKDERRDDREHIGYIAQDVEELAPFMVVEMDDGTKSLDYIQLLTAKVEYLERKLEQLEARSIDDGR